MLLLIIAGIGYALWYDSIPASVLTAALVLYRAQRPSSLGRRFREAMLNRQVAQIGESE